MIYQSAKTSTSLRLHRSLNLTLHRLHRLLGTARGDRIRPFSSYLNLVLKRTRLCVRVQLQGHDFNQYGRKRLLIVGCVQEQANAILKQRL